MSLLTSQSAHAQYAQRPPDERFPSLQALIDVAAEDKRLSAERTYNLKDLRAVVADDGKNLLLTSGKGTAQFTHWSFGQTARMLGAPASFLRDDLSPELARDVLNYRLQQSAPGSSANILVRAANGQPPTIRACTSESYGRAWDSEIYGALGQTLAQQDSRWQLPPTWTGEAAGAYRGDRDSFLILVNGGSIVKDPSLRDGRALAGLAPEQVAGAGPSDGMYRGILVRNSEVGASSVVIETILFRYVCGNHMLWGAVADKTFRRRHVGANVTRDTIREIARIAFQWGHASAARDEAIITSLISHEIATTKEGVIDELRALGATKEQAIAAYDTCERVETASPRSFWGLAQGLTRDSQASPYQDERYDLDKLAGLVLARGAKLVRV